MRHTIKNQNVRRLMSAFAFMLFTAAVINSVPAKPGLKRLLTLSDGSKVSALLIGDEYGHYWLGDDGNTYQSVSGTSVYELVNAQEVRQRAQVRRRAANQRRMRRLAPQKVGEVGSITGQKKGLIILANFSDASFNSSNNNALYQRIANEKNFSYGDFKGSMYDYFYAQSEGQFELTFDVVGPVTVSKTSSYYGSNDSQGNDKYPATMVIEALKLANSQVNYADYDWDGDGEVEQVYVVYAGKGEADGGASTTIWPHEWELSSAAQYGDGSGAQTLDGVKINTYACGGELNGETGSIAGIGTMCHEFSHCLGYPDFYDTDYSGGQGMFEWDLMDSGSYNGDGYLPAGYTGYERWVAGWKTPIELTSTQAVTNMKALQQGGETYVIYNQGNRNEYYMLENRQQVGWDEGVPGEGLLIVHVDYSSSAWSGNTPNDDPSHQRMTWVAADNKYQYTTYQGTKYYTTEGAANDPFPYGSVNAFSKSTTPAAKFYNKNSDGTYYLDSSIEEITQNSDGTVSFNFRGVSNVATPVFSPKGGRYAETQTVSITCETGGSTIYYTLDGSTPSTSSSVYSAPLTISETTTVKAVAVADGEESAVATAKYTIGASSSDPDTKTFRLVSSTDDLEAGLRYVIACGSKSTAAGSLSSNVLGSKSVTVEDDVITITDDVAVFVLDGDQTSGWTFQNESDNKYLYATTTKKLAYATDSKTWTLSNGTDGVIMTYGSYGTMLYNAGNPRFTTYTSSPTASMIQANLYVEESNGSTPVTHDPFILADESLEFSTTVGTPQTLRFGVLSEGLTEDITATLTDVNNVFSLASTTISRTDSENNGVYVDVTFSPTAAGTFTATVTLSSAGADDVTVVLSGTAADDTPVVGTDSFELVTDASTLAANDEILIAYVSADDDVLVMSTTQNTNNRAATTDVTLNSDGTLTPGNEAQVITLEKDGSNFMFNVGNAYLYAASSSKNHLKTTTTVSDNAKATISISSGDATITFQGNYTRNTMRYNPNNSNPIFSCYSSTSTTGYLPQIYRRIVHAIPTITLYNAADNTSLISENDSVVANVVIDGRTLYHDGTWNTLCLPFDVDFSTEDSPLYGAQVKELESAAYNNGTLILNFVESSKVLAGKPYIVKWTDGENVQNPVFGNVTITLSDMLETPTDVVRFVGTYDPLTFETENKHVLFMGSDNKLYYPNGQAPTNVKSFRAYFQLAEGYHGEEPLSVDDLRSIVVNYDDETTGIIEISNDKSVIGNSDWYDLSGRRLNGMPTQRGVYIHDGQKVMIK